MPRPYKGVIVGGSGDGCFVAARGRGMPRPYKGMKIWMIFTWLEEGGVDGLDGGGVLVVAECDGLLIA